MSMSNIRLMWLRDDRVINFRPTNPETQTGVTLQHLCYVIRQSAPIGCQEANLSLKLIILTVCIPSPSVPAHLIMSCTFCNFIDRQVKFALIGATSQHGWLLKKTRIASVCRPCWRWSESCVPGWSVRSTSCRGSSSRTMRTTSSRELRSSGFATGCKWPPSSSTPAICTEREKESRRRFNLQSKLE